MYKKGITVLLVSLIILVGSTSAQGGDQGAGASLVSDPTVESDAWLTEKFTGDFGAMAKIRVVKALIPYSKTFYFLDRGAAKGASHDLLKEFEKELNKKQKNKHLKTHVLIIPTARDKLLPNLQAGLGDLAVGNLTITKERQKKVDFSDPFLSGVDEIVVTAGNAVKLMSVSDLSGKTKMSLS